MSEPIKITEDGGILKTIIKEAPIDAPQVKNGKRITCHYVGTLENGKQFDSSRDRNSPFRFVIGNRSVILGWEYGILSMKVGERSRLTIKSDYGYGDSGAGGVIPPKATLIFDVEVLEMNEPEETKSLIRIILFSILIFFFYYFYFKK